MTTRNKWLAIAVPLSAFALFAVLIGSGLGDALNSTLGYIWGN